MGGQRGDFNRQPNCGPKSKVVSQEGIAEPSVGLQVRKQEVAAVSVSGHRS